MGSIIEGLKQVGTNFIEGIKEKLATEKENNDNPISFSVDGNSSEPKNLDELMQEYSESQKNIGGTENKEEALLEKESKTMLVLYEKLESTIDEDQKETINYQIWSAETEFQGEKIMLEIESQIQNSDLPQDQKTELINLYNKAAESKDKDAKEANQAELEAYLASIGIDKNDNFIYGLNRNLMIAQNAFADAEILEQISETTDSKERRILQDKRMQELEEYYSEVNQLELEHYISSLDIDDSKKEELSELYQEFTNTIDEDEQALISAKIEAFASANDIPKEILTEMNLNANDIAFSKELAKEFEKLANSTDYDQREALNAKISVLQEMQNKNMQELQIEKEFQMSNLPEEQKETLTNLYNLLNNTVDEDNRNKIKAEIKNYMSENGIDENSSTMLWVNYRATNIEQGNKLTELYEKLSNTTSSEQRDAINAQIAQVISEYTIESENLHAKAFIQDSNIPTETKEELMSLYDQITNSTDSTEIEKLSAEIQKILDNTEFDKNSNTERCLNQDLQHIILEKGLKLEYEKLANCTNSEERQKINENIKTMTEEYSKKYEEIKTRLAKEKYTIEDNISPETKQTTNGEFEKISKAIKQMGFSIPKDITSVEELKDYMDEIQTIIDENLEDSFGSFG